MSCKHTLYASYLGYITQAIVNNLMPLLFVTFNEQFDISLGKIGLLISINFFNRNYCRFISSKVC